MNFKKQLDKQKARIRKRGKNRLLPPYFKWIGLFVTLLPIAMAIILKLQGLEFGVGKVIFPSICTLGLLMVVISRDKLEDEMKTQLRGQAFTYSFLFGVLYGAGLPLVDLIMSPAEIVGPVNVPMVLITMLVTYVTTFNLLKWAS